MSYRISVVGGSTLTGIYAANGSINVVVAPSPVTRPIGVYAPCGAWYVTVAGSTTKGVYAPDGSLYVTENLSNNNGPLKVVVTAGSLSAPDTTPPTITTAATANIAENSTLAISLTANETVSWSLHGGADASSFEISGTTLRWLSNGTKNFEVPTDADTNNTYVVIVRATDTSSNVTDKTITVTVTNVNEAPVVSNAIPDQSAADGTPFSFQFASNAFTDVDAGTTLTYTATKSDNSALPGWLTFTAGTRTFSGTPSTGDIGTVSVKVTASDGALTVSDTFDLVVGASGTAAAPTAAILTLTSGPDVNHPTFEALFDPALPTSTPTRFKYSQLEDFSVVTNFVGTIAAPFPTFSALANGDWYFRLDIEQVGHLVSPSNVEFEVIEVTPTGTIWDSAHNSTHITLSGGSLVATSGSGSGANTFVRATPSKSTGKYYAEFTLTSSASGSGIGITDATPVPDTDDIALGTPHAIVFGFGNCQAFQNGTSLCNNFTNPVTGDILSMAVDVGAGLIWFRLNNNNWNAFGGSDPATGTNGISYTATAPVFPAANLRISGEVITANFGTSAYTYSVPSGFGNWV